jgi:hypothetical protein
MGLDDAVCDLRAREGTVIGNIGRIDVSLCRLGDQPENPIIVWARLKKLDGVVWTALKSNFEEKRKHLFSVAAAVSYLKTLGPEGKAKAAEYIWRAPMFVKTDLRSALQREPWFSEESR